MKSTRHLHFPGQKNNEHIIILIRKHWIIDVKIFSIFLIIEILPLFVATLIGGMLWNSNQGDLFWTYILGFVVYSLFIVLFIYLRWLNEELDLVMVTNERIISHNQVDIFHRQVSEALVEDIQDVKGIEKGMLGHLFHFGAMEITTSSNKIFFEIENVNNPYKNTRALLDVRDEYASHQTNL